MQALILAAGIGRRMRPLTDAQHKTLLPISGGTIIDRILAGLGEHGVSPITIVTGHRSEELRAHVGSRFPALDIHYVHNPEFESTNNIHSMWLALDAMDLDDDVVLIESDLIYEPRVLERLLGSAHENVALLDRYRPGMDGTVVTLGETGSITAVIPPALQPSDFSFADKFKTLNMYRFSASFCRNRLKRLLEFYTRTFDRNCYYELILGMLVYLQQADVHGEVIDGERWAEVDDPNDLRLAEFTFDPARRFEALTGEWGGFWNTDLLDFSFIRNMYFPTPAMLSELRFNLPAVLQGYGSRQTIVDQKLAWALQWPAEYVHAVAGTSQCFPWMRSWFRGRRVLIPDPTFGEYQRVFPAAEGYPDSPGLDWAALERAAESADVVVFVNPNNPTGTTIGTQRLVDFARADPARTVVVDESFLEFSDESSVVERLREGDLDNVLVLKSLSKTMGIPGLRLGALCTSSPEISARLAEDMPIWNVNSVAEHFLEVMLKHRPDLESSYQRTRVDRDEFARSLKESSLVDTVFPSGGDFLLVRLAGDAARAADWARLLAERHGILVKDASAKLGDGRGYWRLPVRTPEDHDVLASAMRGLP